MDTWTLSKEQAEALVVLMRDKMPSTTARVREEATCKGNGVYAVVRRGLRGEPGCFWAIEAGHVIGTPLGLEAVLPDVAMAMVTFGASFVCAFGPEVEKVAA